MLNTKTINENVKRTFRLLDNAGLPYSTECALWIAKHWIEDHKEELEDEEGLYFCLIDELDIFDYWKSYIRQEIFPKNGATPTEFKATNIVWDTDEEEVNLPSEILIPLYIPEEEANDYISDLTGFCHYGFDIEFVGQE